MFHTPSTASELLSALCFLPERRATVAFLFVFLLERPLINTLCVASLLSLQHHQARHCDRGVDQGRQEGPQRHTGTARELMVLP